MLPRMTRASALAAVPALAAAGLIGLVLRPAAQEPSGEPAPSAEEQQLVESLAARGVSFHPRAGLVAFPARVEVVDDLLEYFLVGPGGARHEAVLTTDVAASVINVALLALGAEPGQNASWRRKEPPPSEEEVRQGAIPYEIRAPAGDGFYLYAGWRRGAEEYLYRAEDLVRDLSTGQTMRRHRWVYLGSRLLPPDRSGTERFAADVYQNLVNVAFFSEGFTLLTAALPECLEQTIWMSNAWLLPERGASVLVVFARERLERAPQSIAASLPDLGPARSPFDLEGGEGEEGPR